MLKSVVQGYFNYHAVPGNTESLRVFRYRVTRLWRQVLIRRGIAGNVCSSRGESTKLLIKASSPSPFSYSRLQTADCAVRTSDFMLHDLVDDHGLTGSYQTVKRLINKLRGSVSAQQPCAVT